MCLFVCMCMCVCLEHGRVESVMCADDVSHGCIVAAIDKGFRAISIALKHT